MMSRMSSVTKAFPLSGGTSKAVTHAAQAGD
jgi:hypothetical protein